ncbi:MAG: trypsin-like peptidase domain-containing protein [Fimbriimonas sp.]
MKGKPRHPKSPYVLIGAGFALGAVSMAGVFNGAAARPAYAQTPGVARTISGVNGENMAALRGLDESYANLAEFVAPSVVEIRASTDVNRRAPDGSRAPQMGGSGSGFVFRNDGWIITNDHVVGGFDKVQVILKDGRSFDGKVTRAEDTDIAVVKIDAKDLPTLGIADSSKVRPGQLVMAVGSPFGLEQSVTFGHISAIGRLQGIQNRAYFDLIQTDTPINVGNSGGPLVNIEGQLVGVNTAIFTTTGGSAGIGFAIPGNQARFIAETLINKGKLTRSMIGLVPENLKDYQKKEMSLEGGARVEEVSSDGPAAAAGIKVGDVVVKIGTTPIHNQMDLRNAMLVYAPGTTVPVELIRDGKKQTLNVKLVTYKKPATPNLPSTPEGMPRMKDFDQFFKDIPEMTPREESDDDVPAIREGQARLGVSVMNLTDEKRKEYKVPANVKGVVVEDVVPGSVAEKNGVRKGDVILSFDGKTIETPEDLTRAVSATKWGEKRKLKTQRFGTGQMTMERDVEFK